MYNYLFMAHRYVDERYNVAICIFLVRAFESVVHFGTISYVCGLLSDGDLHWIIW